VECRARLQHSILREISVFFVVPVERFSTISANGLVLKFFTVQGLRISKLSNKTKLRVPVVLRGPAQVRVGIPFLHLSQLQFDRIRYLYVR
jgi:hypothetical protein